MVDYHSLKKWLIFQRSFRPDGEWPSSSPDLNPLDYCIWDVLDAKACAKNTHIVEWKRLDQNIIRTLCEAFRMRLELVLKAKGGYLPIE